MTGVSSESEKTYSDHHATRYAEELATEEGFFPIEVINLAGDSIFNFPASHAKHFRVNKAGALKDL